MSIALADLRAATLIAALACVVTAIPATADQARQQADEQEMLAKARQEAGERRAVRPLQGTVGNAPVAAQTDRQIVNIGAAPTPPLNPADASAREAELQRLSEKLRRASQLRTARPTAQPVETPWRTEVTVVPDAAAPRPDYRPEQRAALGHRAAAEATRIADDRDGRATVLMVMTPGNRGIRRFDRTADPILCSNDGCYISNGGTTPAQFVSLRRSFGFLNTFGPRAGACRHTTACVFRGVDVSAANTILQPVDLRVMLHDRRDIRSASVDDTCRVETGRLSCERPLRGDGFTLWVVPERVAAKAGSEALLRAVEEGLPDPTRRAALGR